MISYKPLNITLARKDLKKTDLIKMTGISKGTLARLGKGDNVALSVIEKICLALDCHIEDVVEITK